MNVPVQRVSADQVRPLRHAVLRPGQPFETTIYPTDEDPATFHAGASAGGGELVGVATVSQETHPLDPRPGDWRLRGMATHPAVRGQGFGAVALRACLDHVRAEGGTRVWCNARAPARGFYEHEGFVAETGAFEIPGIGQHYVMSISL